MLSRAETQPCPVALDTVDRDRLALIHTHVCPMAATSCPPPVTTSLSAHMAYTAPQEFAG